MAGTVRLADTSFLLSLLDFRDRRHEWASAQARHSPPPWKTCEAVLSEAFFLLPRAGVPSFISLLRRGSLVVSFDLFSEQEPVLSLMEKYADVPMSLADACLVRMSEMYADAVVFTADSDFHIYRRHGRQVIPCVTPH